MTLLTTYIITADLARIGAGIDGKGRGRADSWISAIARIVDLS